MEPRGQVSWRYGGIFAQRIAEGLLMAVFHNISCQMIHCQGSFGFGQKTIIERQGIFRLDLVLELPIRRDISLVERGFHVFEQGAILRGVRSEEHTSELQSLRHLVCRLLLEKK